MSELHTYRVHWSDPRTGSTGATNAPAFTADDALTQHWLEHPDRKAYRVEPLLDSREPTAAPVAGVNLEPLDGTARAATPEDRADPDLKGTPLRDTLLTGVDLDLDRSGLLFEIHRQRQACGDTFDDVRLLVDAITGTPDPGNHTCPSAAGRIARETRGRLKQLDAAAGKWRDTLNEIAAIVWPGKTPAAAKEYALADLVEAVRKMRAERDRLGAEVNLFGAGINGYEACDDRCGAEAVEFARRARDTKRERDALQKRIDDAKARIHAHPWNAAPSAFQDHLLAILEGREP